MYQFMYTIIAKLFTITTDNSFKKDQFRLAMKKMFSFFVFYYHRKTIIRHSILSTSISNFVSHKSYVRNALCSVGYVLIIYFLLVPFTHINQQLKVQQTNKQKKTLKHLDPSVLILDHIDKIFYLLNQFYILDHYYNGYSK